MNYGSMMKDIREDNDITQQMMADILKISRTAYKQFELQYDIIPIKRLNDFCNYFNISIDYVLGFNNERNYKHNKKNINLEESGYRLRKIRKERKITQVKMAEMFNISYGIISEYEKGHYPISTATLYQICKTFNVSADYLLGKSPVFILLKRFTDSKLL